MNVNHTTLPIYSEDEIVNFCWHFVSKMKTVAHRGVYCSMLAMICERCQNYGRFNKRPVIPVPRCQATKT
jgi:hypothetical protein